MLEVAHTDKKVLNASTAQGHMDFRSCWCPAILSQCTPLCKGDGSWAASAGCAVTADTIQVRSLMSNRSLRVFCSHAGMLC